MSGPRLRLTTSRPAGYRRGGQVIGGAAAPAFIGPGDVTPEQMLAILRDPNIAVAIETEEDVFRALTAEERVAIEAGAETALDIQLEDLAKLAAEALGLGAGEISVGRREPVSEPNTSGPQGGGSDPAAEASKASGPEATANASAGSAADAGTPEPEKPAAADPVPSEPAPAPAAPTSKGTGKPKTVKGKS